MISELLTLSIARFLRLSAHVQMLPILESGEETTLIGGQAVMEGVMMRAPHSYCIAVRRLDGTIVYETKELAKVSEKYPIFRLAPSLTTPSSGGNTPATIFRSVDLPAPFFPITHQRSPRRMFRFRSS